MTQTPIEHTSPMLEQAALASKSAVVMGHGGGSDCFLAQLIGVWLQDLGVQKVLVGGIACQWWPVDPSNADPFIRVVGPEFYDPTAMTGVETIHKYAVIVEPGARLDDRIPHEATLATYTNKPTFILSHQGGADGSRAGLAAIIEYAHADLVLSVDVGSDTMSTGNEVRPVQTAMADHLSLAALVGQDIPAYFCLAGYGSDAEMEIEELDRNFAAVLEAGGLRGAIIPSGSAMNEFDKLHELATDPIGPLVSQAYRGRFGLYRVKKESPWGQVAKIGPCAVPTWVMDPYIVMDTVASHVKLILNSKSLREAQDVYLGLGRLPESAIVRSVNFSR